MYMGKLIMDTNVKKFDNGIYQIDVMMENKESRMACYYIDSKEPILIEVGPSKSFPYLISGLESIGISNISRTVITHLHLDHVGGIGHLIEEYRDSFVHIHELGLRHLANPEKLWKAVASIYGEEWLKKNWGEILPTPIENIVRLSDEKKLTLGNNRYLDTIYSPGHAKHHYTFYDQESGTLFMGDTLGLVYPHGEIVQPNLPPPDFNKEILFTTLNKLKNLELEQLAIAHFGIHNNPYYLIDQAMEQIDKWIVFIKIIPSISDNEAAKALKGWVKTNYEMLGIDVSTINNYIENGNFTMQVQGIKNYLIDKS